MSEKTYRIDFSKEKLTGYTILVNVLAVLLAVFFLLVFVLGISRVDGTSMSPTLSDHQIVLYSKLSTSPMRGDIAAIVQAAVAAAVKPLQDKINGFESNQSAKLALETAKAKFFGGDYAKKYKDQAEDAWERAVEMNEATGSKKNADQLFESASGYFTKAVARIGVDTSKPFVADPDPEHKVGTTDWKAEAARQKARHGIKEPASQQ